MKRLDILLGGPVHEGVGSNEWRKNVEDLCLGSSVGVEEGIVEHTSGGSLTVLRERVGSDTLHWGRNT